MGHKIVVALGAIFCVAMFAGLILYMFGMEQAAVRLSVGSFVFLVALILLYVFRGRANVNDKNREG